MSAEKAELRIPVKLSTPGEHEGKTVDNCPADCLYIVMDNGTIIWNAEAEGFFADGTPDDPTAEYWVAWHLWNYTAHLRSVN